MAGTYDQTTSLDFTASDSGTADSPIIWQSIGAANYNLAGWSSYPHFTNLLSDEPEIAKYNTISNCLVGDTPVGKVEGTPAPQVAISGVSYLQTAQLRVNKTQRLVDANSPIITGSGSFKGIDVTKIFGCGIGDVAGPATSNITNLARVPNPGLKPSGWSGYGGQAVPYTAGDLEYTVQTVSGMSLSQAVRCTTLAATNSSEVTYGPWSTMDAEVAANQTYTISIQTRPSVDTPMYIRVRWYAADMTGLGVVYGSIESVAANQTTTLYTTAQAPAAVAYLQVAVFTQNPLVVGSYIDVTAGMVVEGSAHYNFADGDSAGWSWTGARGESGSTGPGVIA